MPRSHACAPVLLCACVGAHVWVCVLLGMCLCLTIDCLPDPIPAHQHVYVFEHVCGGGCVYMCVRSITDRRPKSLTCILGGAGAGVFVCVYGMCVCVCLGGTEVVVSVPGSCSASCSEHGTEEETDGGATAHSVLAHCMLATVCGAVHVQYTHTVPTHHNTHITPCATPCPAA